MQRYELATTGCIISAGLGVGSYAGSFVLGWAIAAGMTALCLALYMSANIIAASIEKKDRP